MSPARYDPYGRPLVPGPGPESPLRAEERRRRLGDELRALVVVGHRIEVRNEYDAIVARGTDVNHVLHGILTVLTGLLWAPVWVYFVLARGVRRTFVSVDPTGRVERRPLPRG